MTIRDRSGSIRNRNICRLCLYVLVPVLAFMFAAHTASAQMSRQFFDIDAQPLAKALVEFARQSDIPVVVSVELVRGKTVASVFGEMVPDRALAALLKGTGLYFRRTNGSITIARIPASRDTSVSPQSDQSGQQSGAIEAQGEIGELSLDEIIVTAARRAQNLQDVPASVTAIGSTEIDRKNIIGVGDHLQTLPGVSFIDRGPGRNAVIIRGVTADPQAETFAFGPTVGVYLGDLPLTTIGIFGTADIKLIDIDRVEVLRGPQGTLYGSNSLAGTVRSIPNAPNFNALEGSVKAGYSNTTRQGGDNYLVQGVINAPLVDDVLAIRAVAYRHENSGYINNIAGSDPGAQASAAAFNAAAFAIDQDQVGTDTSQGGRISVLWQPAEKFKANFTFLMQDLRQDGLAEVELDKGTYEQSRFQLGPSISGGERLADDIRIANLTLDYDLGWAGLTSSSSWLNEDTLRNRTLPVLFDGVPLAQTDAIVVKSLVQEVRLASQTRGPFQFVAGVYYEDIEAVLNEFLFWGGEDVADNIFVPGEATLIDFQQDELTKQIAVFGEVSYDFSAEFKATVGGRYFNYDRRTKLAQGGFFTGAPLTDPAVFDTPSEDNGTTFKAGLSYTPTSETLVYAQWSEGFRLGRSVNPAPADICDLNSDGIFDGTGLSIDTDRTRPDDIESVEVGGKFQFFNRRVVLNTSVYYNKWTDIPVNVAGTCGLSLQANAGKARTQGLEIESRMLLTNQLSVDAGFSLVDAELTRDVPNVGGANGDRLPGSPSATINLGFHYEYELYGFPAFIRANYAYVSGFYNNLAEVGQKAGDYHRANLKAGVQLGRVSLELFVNNLSNSDGLTWVDSILPGGNANRMRPRTIGFSTSYIF